MMRVHNRATLLATLLSVLFVAAVSSQPVDLSTVKAGEYDNGKMWTFDYPPVDVTVVTSQQRQADISRQPNTVTTGFEHVRQQR